VTTRGDLYELVDNHLCTFVEAVLDHREGKIGSRENLSAAEAELCTALCAVFGLKERAANPTES
jgi:hypothetical protein